MGREKQLQLIKGNVERVIKGKSDVIKQAIIGILARGHILIEDVPGVGKTTLAYLLARSIDCSFQRVQFTSDLLPSDILGVTVYDQKEQQFIFKSGPIFANIVLADEINRTTPKTQSSLLEAMNTAQVSIDKKTYDLPQPFIVIATQNPIEFHGTFPLPKSQLDRFLLRLRMGYPELDDEVVILKERKETGLYQDVDPVIDRQEVLKMQKEVAEVKVDEDLLQYIANIAAATRRTELVELGISPRGALHLRRTAQARAYFYGRDYCIPDDIKSMAIAVLAHRIQIASTFEAASGEREDEQILQRVIEQVEVPL